MNGKAMIGDSVFDLKKNTNRAKHVNDRLRRRSKRLEREQVAQQLSSGELYFSVLFKL